jgi:diacylglycerol kinase (ATP)
VDGVPEAHEALIACAANGQSFGGGIPIAPRAALDDGLMDVVIIDGIRKIAIPRAFIMLMKRRVLELRQTLFKRQPRLTVRPDAPMAIQIDGEIYEDLPFDVELVHGVLRFYRP